jgi:hypothetical protein
MSKQSVSRLFIGSLIAGIAGVILALAAGGTAYANDVFVVSGNQITGVHWTPLAWSMLGLGIVGSLALIAAAIGGLVAWIGALLNTSQLESKTWFLVLLLLGIFSFGFFAMVAYVIAGPDGTSTVAPTVAPVPA